MEEEGERTFLQMTMSIACNTDDNSTANTCKHDDDNHNGS